MVLTADHAVTVGQHEDEDIEIITHKRIILHIKGNRSFKKKVSLDFGILIISIL